MPELPEVETVCRGLHSLMQGKKLARVTLRRKDLRAPFPKGMENMLRGRRVEKIERRAKYILIRLSGGKTLLVHLGMSGRMSAVRDGHRPEKHDHVVFEIENPKRARAGGRGAERMAQRIIFNDPRRFGLMDVLETKTAHEHKLLKHIGIEPLSKELNARHLAALFKGKKVAVKVALMDQRLIAGIGNIYACEALFYARINPKKRAGRVSADELERLAPAIKKVLQKSIAYGGSTLRDYTKADGELGGFQNEFAVYGRTGKRCKNCVCDIQKTGGVQCFTQGGRSTFYCPVKQT